MKFLNTFALFLAHIKQEKTLCIRLSLQEESLCRSSQATCVEQGAGAERWRRRTIEAAKRLSEAQPKCPQEQKRTTWQSISGKAKKRAFSPEEIKDFHVDAVRFPLCPPDLNGLPSRASHTNAAQRRSPSKALLGSLVSGFSLVEILVALIIVSLIMAALAPVITKKLSSAGITIVGGGSGGGGSGVSTSCAALDENCTLCMGSECVVCKNGYVLEHGLCVAEHPATREPASQEDCTPFNALFIPKEWNGGVSNVCVTKYNVGDPGGPPIINSAKRLIAGDAQSVCKNEDQGNCCWQGRTAASCTDNDRQGSSYSGCDRTVCQYDVGKASCENWEPFINGYKVSGWRLPSYTEANAWVTRVNSTSGKDGILKQMGAEGLQMCKASVNFIENYTLCQSSNGCYGALNGTNCYPCDVLLKDTDSTSKYYVYKINNSTAVNEIFESDINSTGGSYVDSDGHYKVASIRCALDKLPYNFKGSKTQNFSSGFQKNSSYITYGAPQKQADCEPYNAVFVPAKYNGENGKNLCVTRYNVGDYGGPPWEVYGGRNNTPIMKFVNQESSNPANTCWHGNTGDANYCIPEIGKYPGCKRTVCGYNNADQSCRRWNPLGAQYGSWRLPTTAEATGWKNSAEVQEILKSNDGAMFCTNNTTDPFVCKTTSVCKGAKGCYPSCYWLKDGENMYHFCWKTGITIHNSAELTEAMSARCVSSNVRIQ